MASTSYKVIGTRPIRHDGTDKVTGRAQFGADIQLSGMLFGAILRSPHAHARIKSIDISQAESYPGVHAVVTGTDLPEQQQKVAHLGEGDVNLYHLSQNVLARQKVLYKGHAVAAVAADDIHIAQEATQLINVEYEVLPPVLDVLEAMQDEAPVLNDDVRTDSMAGEESKDPTNVAKHYFYEKGNIEKGFEAAHVVIEREYRTSTVHQGYIEPHNATALWNQDGQITIWTSTQGSFMVRQQMADLLKLPESRIKVVPMEIGGGFGGKISVYLQPVAALLSKKSGRPVKLVMDRASVFEATGPTPGSYIRVKMGADREGKLTAAEAYVAFEAGGFPGSPVVCACMCIFACYDVPHGRINGYDVCVNKPRSNAYRAPGSTHAAFAAESVVDEICERLEMDPVEFRLKNAAQEGTRRVDGVQFARIGMKETVEAIRDSEHWKSSLEGKYRGRGIASGFWFNVGLKSSVTAMLAADGTVSLLEGSTDIGGTRASLSMQLAETLGIAAEDIKPAVVDTDSVGYNDVTGGSRVTFSTGIAVHNAGLEMRRQLIERVANIWEVKVEDVQYEDGKVRGPGGKEFTFRELAAKIHATGEPITVKGTSGSENQAGAFGTHCVDVEVDPETGKVDVLRYTIAQDCGTAIHPAYVEGQMQGGAAQGIGWALNEEYVYDEHGAMRNATFLDYRIPTCCDLPMMDTIIVEVPDPQHPFGVRGVGEVPIAPPPAALVAAIYQAVGVRMRELPASPPRLLHQILQR
ncbi:MAG: oxidoreductase [Planctomycetaceae bacterium]|nr:oxidoreductase [Planctomycetaceae bacterium]MBP62797.1 oxidoreductase [Planctomycetaceae bacterium]